MIRPLSRPAPLVAVLAGVLVVSACGAGASGRSGAKTATSLNVSFANATEASDLFHSLHTGLDGQIASKNLDVSVKWYDNNLDAAAMQKNADLMVQDKPDAIVSFPITSTTAGMGKLFTQAKIPCVSLNNPTPGCTFLNVDDAPTGRAVADAFTAEAASRGWNSSNTTILIGDYAAAGETVNIGVWEFYRKIAPAMGYAVPATLDVKSTKLAANAYQFDTAGTTDGSFAAVKNLVPSIPKGNHVMLFTVADDATIGALHALDDAGLGAHDNALVAGIGGAKAGIDALRNDPRWIADGAVFLDYWGIYALAAAKAMVSGAQPTGKVTALPEVLLTKDNVRKYYPDGSATAVALPPLVASNQWLAKAGLLQKLNLVQGLS